MIEPDPDPTATRGSEGDDPSSGGSQRPSGVTSSAESGELLALVDRLGLLLDENDLAEVEVESRGTRVLLRRTAPASHVPTPAEAAPVPLGSSALAGLVPTAAASHETAPQQSPAAAAAPASSVVPVVSPLTGVFYASPTPGAAPYIQPGARVTVGQVIALVEAMKLFNEIKSDVAGRVVRVVPETGTLVKAKQTLIEVEPL